MAQIRGFFITNDIMKDDNFYVVFGWMHNELDLKGTELQAYAIIWGFCQGEHDYKGSATYLQNTLGIARKTATRALKVLEERGFIEKHQEIGQKGLINRYTLVRPPGSKLPNPPGQNYPTPRVKTTHSNIKGNIKGNKEGIDWKVLIDFINKKTGREFQVVNDKAKKAFRQRLKEGYTKQQIFNAIINCSRDPWHKERNFRVTTPEWFSRASTLDRHGDTPKGDQGKSNWDILNEGGHSNF